MCSALAHGALRKDIELHIEECDKGRPKEARSAAEAMAVAEKALSDSNSLFTAETSALERTLAVLGIVLAISRILQIIPNPAGRLAVVASAALRNIVQNQITRIQGQAAANDAAIAIVRQAAANEGQFLLRAGL